MKKTSIGFAMTGSFCTFERVLKQMEALVRRGYEVVPVLSFNAGMLDTRFMTAEHLRARIVEITGKSGVRRIPIKEFYLKAGTVDLKIEDGEIQTAILIPKASYDRTWGHYIKYAMRNAMDIATLGTSVNARLSPDGKTFERVRIAFGVAGPVPMRAVNAEAFINGKAVTLENIEAFGRKVLEDINPRDSWRASKAFRSHIAVESAKRCLIESVKLAGGEL